MRLRPFILCFNRTAFAARKSGLKSSVFHSKLFSQISSKSYRHNAVPNRFSSRFLTSLTNAPRSLSRAKVGTHSAFGERSHTTAHTPKQGPPRPRPQQGFSLPAKSLCYTTRFHRAFIYIHFPVLCETPLSATALSQATSRHVFQLLSQTAHVRSHSRKRVHTRLRQQDRTQRLTRRNRGRFGRGRYYYYPRSALHGSETLRGRVSERQTLPPLGLGLVCSRKTQKAFGTAMRLCASLSRWRRGPAGLRTSVITLLML